MNRLDINSKSIFASFKPSKSVSVALVVDNLQNKLVPSGHVNSRVYRKRVTFPMNLAEVNNVWRVSVEEEVNENPNSSSSVGFSGTTSTQ